MIKWALIVAGLVAVLITAIVLYRKVTAKPASLPQRSPAPPLAVGKATPPSSQPKTNLDELPYYRVDQGGIGDAIDKQTQVADLGT